MSVLLIILKIVGWVVLGIVALLLLALSLVLFLHAGYQGVFETGEDISEAKVTFRASWFFSIFQFHYRFEKGEQECFYKILGRKTLIPEEKKTVNKKETAQSNQVCNQQSNKSCDNNKKAVSETVKSDKKKKEKMSFKERFIGIKEMLTEQNNHRAFLIFVNELKYLCKHWGPRRFKANLAFSAGDPANTGIVLGIISVFPVVYKKDVILKTDFESDKMYLLGHAMFKGRIRLVHLVKIIFSVFVKDETRSLIFKFMKQ